jgi:hypothetical protein
MADWVIRWLTRDEGRYKKKLPQPKRVRQFLLFAGFHPRSLGCASLLLHDPPHDRRIAIGGEAEEIDAGG